MKKILLIFVLILTSLFVNAQYYYLPFINAGTNPGGLNNDAEYPNGGGLATTWSMILAGSQTSPAWSTAQTLPFTFNFNGSPVTSFKVSSSGVLTFAQNAGTAPSYSNLSLPNAAIPDSSICVWGLKGEGSNDNVMVKTFGTAPNRQFWVFFSSYLFTGGSSTAWTYWSIVLEETTNNIYIVDQRTGNGTPALSVGIQINSTTAISVSGSPAVGTHAGTDATPADNSFYKFVFGSMPVRDIFVSDLDLPGYIQPNDPVSIKGTIDNLGSAAIASFDLNYSVNGGTPITNSYTGLNINSLANYTFTHPTNWTPTTAGNYSIKVWTSNINGAADENHLNDTLTGIVQVVTGVIPRLPLYETFTSSTCAPCVAGNTNMEGLFDDNPGKWVAIKYQMSWPGSGDPYYTAEGGVRRTYYAVNSVPNQQIDGGYNGNSSAVTQTDFDNALSIPSFVSLEAYMIVDTVQKHVTVGTTINSNIDLPASARLYVGLVEKKTFNNVASNGETEFHWVMKKMLPDAEGTIIGPYANGTLSTKFVDYTFNGSYRLPANATVPINNSIEHSVEEFGDLIAVCWIQNYTTKEVYQSCYSSVTLGIADQHPEKLIGTYYPNPATNQVNFNFNLNTSEEVSLTILNNLGQEVKKLNLGKVEAGNQNLTVDINELNSGIYFFRFMIGSTPFTKPVVVE